MFCSDANNVSKSVRHYIFVSALFVKNNYMKICHLFLYAKMKFHFHEHNFQNAHQPISVYHCYLRLIWYRMTIFHFLWCAWWRYFKANLHKEMSRSFEEIWCNATLQYLSICLLLQILFFNQNFWKRIERLAPLKTNNHKELVRG